MKLDAKTIGLIIFAISLFAAAIASDEYCYKGKWIYHYQNGILKDSVTVKSAIESCDSLIQDKRIKKKEWLSQLKYCE